MQLKQIARDALLRPLQAVSGIVVCFFAGFISLAAVVAHLRDDAAVANRR